MEDSIFETGTFLGVIEKFSPFLRAVVSTGVKTRLDMLTTYFSWSTTVDRCVSLLIRLSIFLACVSANRSELVSDVCLTTLWRASVKDRIHLT